MTLDVWTIQGGEGKTVGMKAVHPQQEGGSLLCVSLSHPLLITSNCNRRARVMRSVRGLSMGKRLEGEDGGGCKRTEYGASVKRQSIAERQGAEHGGE